MHHKLIYHPTRPLWGYCAPWIPARVHHPGRTCSSSSLHAKRPLYHALTPEVPRGAARNGSSRGRHRGHRPHPSWACSVCALLWLGWSLMYFFPTTLGDHFLLAYILLAYILLACILLAYRLLVISHYLSFMDPTSWCYLQLMFLKLLEDYWRNWRVMIHSQFLEVLLSQNKHLGKMYTDGIVDCQ